MSTPIQATRSHSRFRAATIAGVGLVVGAALMVALPAANSASSAQQQVDVAHSQAEALANPITDLCAGSKGAQIAQELASARTPDGQSLCPAAREVQTQSYPAPPVTLTPAEVRKIIHDELVQQGQQIPPAVSAPTVVPRAPAPVIIEPQKLFPNLVPAPPVVSAPIERARPAPSVEAAPPSRYASAPQYDHRGSPNYYRQPQMPQRPYQMPSRQPRYSPPSYQQQPYQQPYGSPAYQSPYQQPYAPPAYQQPAPYQQPYQPPPVYQQPAPQPQQQSGGLLTTVGHLLG